MNAQISLYDEKILDSFAGGGGMIPLTLKELRKMKWEPAWVDGTHEPKLDGRSGWAILYWWPVDKYVMVCWPLEEYADVPSLDNYGDTWKAYPRPPKED